MWNSQEKEAIKDYQQVLVIENQLSPMEELLQNTGETNPFGPTIKNYWNAQSPSFSPGSPGVRKSDSTESVRVSKLTYNQVLHGSIGSTIKVHNGLSVREGLVVHQRVVLVKLT